MKAGVVAESRVKTDPLIIPINLINADVVILVLISPDKINGPGIGFVNLAVYQV
jgi:hypothetical protein